MSDDDDPVEQVAREYVQRHGADAVSILRERADMAHEISDLLSAEAWRDIADAAERILREGRLSQATHPNGQPVCPHYRTI